MLLYSQVRPSAPSPSASAPVAFVFLHYFGGSSEAWRHVGGKIQNLCPACPQVFLDLRGHGNSPDAPTHTVSEMADDVRETLASLPEVDDLPILLVGHSMGGKVALCLAASGLPRLASLVLIAPSPPSGEPMTDAERETNLRGWGSDSTSRQTLDKIAHLPVTTDDSNQFVWDRGRTTKEAWEDWFAHGTRENLTSAMNQIHVPTVIVSGECDPVIPADVQRRETLSYLHDAFLSVVPRAGHLLPYEAPDAIAEIIASFLPPEK